jgi:two-component system sensor histidine kinase/response regulator
MHNPPIVVSVDDEPAILELVKAQLTPENYDLRRFAEPGDLLDEPETLRSADLFLLDVMMPGMDGFELCEEIRQQREDFVPIIMVTALGETEYKVRGLDAGADDFITKPTNAAELRARVRANLRSKKFHDQLEEANVELTRLGHMRDSLTDMIVHDLRNPLGSLSLALQMLGDPPDASLIDSDTWELTRQQVNYALEMCEQLLDIKKLQSDSLEIHIKRTQIQELVADAISSISLRARERGVRIEQQTDEASLMTDAVLIKRVLLNLLNNAVKYSPPDDVVTIRALKENDKVTIAVHDNGPGIPPEAHDRIFEMFGTAQIGSEVKGYGIGLAFSKLACDALKGNINIDSAPGKGSRFTLVLPDLR